MSVALISKSSWEKWVLPEPLFSCNIEILKVELQMFPFCTESPAGSSNRGIDEGCCMQSARDVASQIRLRALLLILPFIFSMILGKPVASGKHIS